MDEELFGCANFVCSSLSLFNSIYRYVAKIQYVSATCRLPIHQELRLLNMAERKGTYPCKEGCLEFEYLTLYSDLVLINRHSYLTSVLEKKISREVVYPNCVVDVHRTLVGYSNYDYLYRYPERAVLKGQFDSIVDKSCLTPHDDTFLSKFSSITYKRPTETTGLIAVSVMTCAYAYTSFDSLSYKQSTNGLTTDLL